MARVALEDWQEQIRDPKIECMRKYWQILTENLKGKAVIVNDQADISFCGKSTGKYDECDKRTY